MSDEAKPLPKQYSTKKFSYYFHCFWMSRELKLSKIRGYFKNLYLKFTGSFSAQHFPLLFYPCSYYIILQYVKRYKVKSQSVAHCNLHFPLLQILNYTLVLNKWWTKHHILICFLFSILPDTVHALLTFNGTK